jgi:hypothetical protein
MAIVTFTTDFGLADGYAGIMKGVALGVDPSLCMVDITHNIAPHNIRQAAYVLDAAFPHFPEGSVHVCVVDPGVGTERAPLVVQAAGHYFVGPDNGVFTRVFRRGTFEARRITNRKYMAEHVSFTFHGRDVFAPAAARLALGAPMASFGPLLEAPALIDAGDAAPASPGTLAGAIVHIDHFGNAVTNIGMDLVENFMRRGGFAKCEVVHHAARVRGVFHSYNQAPDAMAACVTVGSWNTLEFFVKGGHAANTHGFCVGDNVEVLFS